MPDHTPRGVIRYEERARQLKNFGGLRYGNITPTDLDGYIEYKDRLWVVMEFKYQDAVMPSGQRLAVERLCRDLSKVKPVIGILASHNHPPSEQIDCALAQVAEIWNGDKWKAPTIPLTVKEAVDAFLQGASLPIDANLIIDWQFGVLCGISGQVCKLCRGVPCAGSTPLETT